MAQFKIAHGQTKNLPTALEEGQVYVTYDNNGQNGKIFADVEIDGETVRVALEGKSAYQYAQEGGYTGTEQEFAQLLNGLDSEIEIHNQDELAHADIREEISQLVADNLPDYVKTEAEAVIDRVISAQGNKTFTFAAITDMHYGNNSYTDGIKHACQALKYIDERIKLDAVAVLGDYTDGYPASGIENALGDLKAVNSLLNELRFAPNLRQQGNHDYYADNTPITHRLIQAYSDNVVWGDKIGGYYYKDFDEFKLRVISLNTVEEDNANIDCTASQYKWFAESLDLSSKDDVDEWQILILSHHPLDWWSNDAGEADNYWYRLPKIIYGYKQGLSSATASGYGENFEPAFDFSKGNNTAKIICNIHGHIHNLLTAKIYLNIGGTSAGTTGVWRMATPNACYGRENGYDGVWKEEVSYDKVQNTAQDTSFVIYCINLDTNIINAICYGAGYDRVLNYLSETTYYSVTNTLTGVTTDNTENSIAEGQPYNATLTSKIGTFTSVVVTMGGVDITSDVYSDGVISIPAVTGNVEIIAIAPTYTNQIPLAVDSDGTAYNGGQGWKANTRLNSGGTETTYENVEVTGFIPVTLGDVIYFKNIKYRANSGGTYSNQEYLAFYDADKNKLDSALLGYLSTFFSENEGSSTFTSDREAAPSYNLCVLDTSEVINWSSSNNKWTNSANMAYFRISAEEITNDSIITKNQPIE